MDFEALEGLSGVRMSWNIWPRTQLDATRIQCPLGCLYTPLKDTRDLEIVGYTPVPCRECSAILNPHCGVDFVLKTWTCSLCARQNAFPPLYKENISEASLPVELLPQCTTMEYILPGEPTCRGPVFLFLVDIAVIEEELDQMKDSIQQALGMLPHNAYVGIITFGAMCYVHELGLDEFPKAYAFRGGKGYTSQQVAYQLGCPVRNDPHGNIGEAAARRFLIPVAEGELVLNCLLDHLSRDAWPTNTDCRPFRCTGSALSIAVGLLEACQSQHTVARLMLLSGGACDVGPGMVVSEQLSETIRSHSDLEKDNDNARHSSSAAQFYSSLAQRCSACGFAVDFFVGALDQVGLHEMRILADKTGGYVVLSDSFSMHVFKDSFRRVFECNDHGYLKFGSNAKLQVFTSRDCKCSGAIGSLAGLHSSGKQSQAAAEIQVGEGGTSQWVTGSLDEQSTFAFYFEIAKEQSQTKSPSKHAFLQFQTSYVHFSGSRHLRVTTLSQRYGDNLIADVATGFDQGAAAVLAARYAVYKVEQCLDAHDAGRWLDRMLIRLAARFADYRRDEPATFRLSSEFTHFPQFMYNLRRSALLRNFNSSPDETAFYRHALLRENTANSLVMIQPTLMEYSFSNDTPIPVALDAESLKPTVILLLDTFFQVVVWRGETVQAWYEAGYQDLQGYENFKQLLVAPAEDAKHIIAMRQPAPKYIQTNGGGSQQRWVTAKVNPSRSDETWQSDDVSLKVFIQELIRQAVQMEP
mmetsp:Transcript_15014/g.34197  ORF Transcript_15014/g.34197 Transcript_15014/m.34197 type:complete len:751 (+) Transcript_15014:63-2315(+)